MSTIHIHVCAMFIFAMTVLKLCVAWYVVCARVCVPVCFCLLDITCELDDGDEIDLGETVTIDDGCTVW